MSVVKVYDTARVVLQTFENTLKIKLKHKNTIIFYFLYHIQQKLFLINSTQYMLLVFSSELIRINFKFVNLS